MQHASWEPDLGSSLYKGAVMCMCDLNPNLETHPSLVRITNWRPEQLVVLLWRCNLNIPALLLEALKRPLNSPKPKTLNPKPETLNPKP